MILDAAVQMTVDKMGVLSHSKLILRNDYSNSKLIRESQPRPAIPLMPQPMVTVGLKVLVPCT